jgi:heme exporter protein A
MQKISLSATGLGKYFGRRKIFSDLTFSVQESNALAITGSNGSGKSTMLKILAGVLSPTRGEVGIVLDGVPVKSEDRFSHLGYVAPYLQLYDEFTGLENLHIFRRIRGAGVGDDSILELLKQVGLSDRKDDFVRTYSSGMKQRLKYAFALLHQPPILLLDEPASNLDREGIATVYEIMQRQKQRGVLIIATNDPGDLQLCDQVINIEPSPGART